VHRIQQVCTPSSDDEADEASPADTAHDKEGARHLLGVTMQVLLNQSYVPNDMCYRSLANSSNLNLDVYKSRWIEERKDCQDCYHIVQNTRGVRGTRNP